MPGHSHSFFFKNGNNMEDEIIWRVDPKPDTIQKFIDNGVFLDGRKKTLDEAVVENSHKTTGARKGSNLTGSKNMTQFTVKEDYHYSEWMKR